MRYIYNLHPPLIYNMVKRKIHESPAVGKREPERPRQASFGREKMPPERISTPPTSPESGGACITPTGLAAVALKRALAWAGNSVRLPQRFEDLGPEAQKALKHLMAELSDGDVPEQLNKLPQDVSQTFTWAVLASRGSAVFSSPSGKRPIPPKIAGQVCSKLGEIVGLDADEFRALAGSLNPGRKK
jgi:hypothetical protein